MTQPAPTTVKCHGIAARAPGQVEGCCRVSAEWSMDHARIVDVKRTR